MFGEDTVKIELSAAAWSNISYARSDVVDTGIDHETWAEMNEEEKSSEVNDIIHDWIWEDISVDWDVVE